MKPTYKIQYFSTHESKLPEKEYKKIIPFAVTEKRKTF